MEFERLYAPSLKELFVRQLQGMILSGELPMGEKLPSERELCEQMRVSRAVVNGGVTELARQGFLEVRPRQGTYVADYRRNGNMDTLMAIMHYNGGVLAREEIRSILEVRQGLEHMTVSRAIACASDEEIRGLEPCLTALEDPRCTPAQAAETAFAFHHGMTLWIRVCRRYGVDALSYNIRRLYGCLLARDKQAASAWIDQYMEEAISGSQQIYTDSQ